MAATIFCMSSALLASDVSVAGEFASADIAVKSAPNSSSIAPLNPAIRSTQQAPAFAPSLEVTQPLTGADEGLSIPAEPSAKSLAALVDNHDDDVSGMDEELRCLSVAVYRESKGESLAGQLAVARVIINRARSGRFADSLCGVVAQPGQFSFVRGRVVPQVSAQARGWKEAVAIARIALADGWDSPAEGALYFHARRVAPGWNLRRVAAIDNHIFYR